MKRDPQRFSDEHFDIVIIGGGILGAFLAHESTRRGFRTALLERDDFASGTTSASGKVLHGGLRYLQHLEPGLAAESNRAQRRIASLAPRLVRPLPFLVPARTGNLREATVLRGGAWTWRIARRLLAGDPDLPTPRYLSRSSLQAVIGQSRTQRFSGAMRFHDYQIRSPERLTVALLADAYEHGAAVANYLEVKRIAPPSDGRLRYMTARDRLSNKELTVHGRMFVNAAGPWGVTLAESVDGSLTGTAFAKGIHVILDRPEPPAALALPLSAQRAGSALGKERRVFLMPWEGRTLAGATYRAFEENDPGRARPGRREVREFLQRFHREWPEFELDDARPVFAYAGLYPIFDGGSSDATTFEASLRPRVIDHEKRGGPAGLVSAISVKLTGAWELAEDVLEIVSAKLEGSGSAPADPSARELRRATPTPLRSSGITHVPAGGSLGRQQVADMIEAAVEEEMARTVPDFLFRRTWLGHFGPPERDDLEFIGRRMGRYLGWEQPEIAEQMSRVREAYGAVPG